ncbi:chemotaxis protein CheW [Marinimicrobium sp. C2-29]|uniref:chemotaxis protein CheW n=1 Tax=Marinimicrobium sp. C2-29 TaxID=3139825 RepID=UPI003139F263
MNTPQPTETADVREVSSLLIPVRDQLLLVPNVSVAEIVPIGEIETVPGAPDWYLGDYRWRDLTIPLASFETLNGSSRPVPGEDARVAVFNTTGVSDHIHFLALLVQGLPRLARVTQEELQVRDDQEVGPCELMHVSWAGEDAVIPDVPGIEQRVLEYLKTRV